MKQTIKIVVIGFLSGILGSYVHNRIAVDDLSMETPVYAGQVTDTLPVAFTPVKIESQPAPSSIANLVEQNFVEASKKSAPTVVYIKTTSQNQYGYSWFDWFFGERSGQSISSGSGVIYTSGGYIITNNHVIEKADQIEVIYNKRGYRAELIGADPSTDIAVLKIDAKNLPAASLGRSRDLQVGEWVIAVGNPFNLASTVTAGIVSAKGREINILKSDFPIESFIQTDAAINPGNSGGALVNVKGELVGINTAILSRTGSYTGYGFAVPVDIVRKVTDDMINYGEVQKAFLGVDVTDITADIASKIAVEDFAGVAVSAVQPDWAGDKAGIQKGDVILKINGELVNARSEFEEAMSYHSPGDKIKITYKRDKKLYERQTTLTNRFGTTSLVKRDIYSSERLGADLETLSDEEKEMLGIDSGVRINQVRGGLIHRLGIHEGFIITHINKNPVIDALQFENNLLNIRGRVIIEGMNSKGMKGYYSFNFN